MGAGLMSACVADAGDVNDRIPAANYYETLQHGVALDGWLGARVALNAQWLLNVDLEPLLAGYRQRPGNHPWIGEHIGKWIDAAVLAWANTGDAALKAKLDYAVEELLATQEQDGYLGTYAPDLRFGSYPGADWDVWSHKYCLIGLISYFNHTGSPEALAGARRAADLLIARFPARSSILEAGAHQGMAATSVLLPIVMLYEATRDARYLEFARYIVGAWDEPGGPAILASLRGGARVDQVANAKAYEMLSNLIGLLAYGRVTGDQSALDAVHYAWSDIVAHQRYMTGAMSHWEYFRWAHDWPDDVTAHLSETCVTTTWIQLNLALLRMTGRARFAEEIERATYNQLAAAQHVDGEDWCYFTPLRGRKFYQSEITCCHSSGPRAMALAPYWAVLRQAAPEGDRVLVNSFEPWRANLQVGGAAVSLECRSEFPFAGRGAIVVRTDTPASFELWIRQPAWARDARVEGARLENGWWRSPGRRWRDGEVVAYSFEIAAAPIPGDHLNEGRTAFHHGPFVLAYDAADNAQPRRVSDLRLAANALPGLREPRTLPLRFVAPTSPEGVSVWRTFADAGAEGNAFRVWVRCPGCDGPADADSLLLHGRALASGNVEAPAIIDDEVGKEVFAVARGDRGRTAWFTVEMDAPVRARRFSFAHGEITSTGGWFDCTDGAPQVQIKASATSPWATIGRLGGYPAATALDPRGLDNGWDHRAYSLVLENEVELSAVRVIGRAAGRPGTEAIVTCAELAAFRR
jgi:DUF1680 family protein